METVDIELTVAVAAVVVLALIELSPVGPLLRPATEKWSVTSSTVDWLPHHHHGWLPTCHIEVSFITRIYRLTCCYKPSSEVVHDCGWDQRERQTWHIKVMMQINKNFQQSRKHRIYVEPSINRWVVMIFYFVGIRHRILKVMLIEPQGSIEILTDRIFQFHAVFATKCFTFHASSLFQTPATNLCTTKVSTLFNVVSAQCP